MDTPYYPPASAFEQPLLVPYTATLRTMSIEELMSRPDDWAIVTRLFPPLKMMTSAPQAKPNLGNMTVYDLARFANMEHSPQLAAADAELRRRAQVAGAGR